jgi:hypothetical protein
MQIEAIIPADPIATLNTRHLLLEEIDKKYG